MNSIELSVFFEWLHRWNCCFIFICNDDIRHFVHDLRKGLEYLVKSLLCLFIANDKTKRNNLLWRTDPYKCTNPIRLLPILDFLNEIECEVKAHPISKLPKVFLHEGGHHDHQVRQFIHSKVVRVAVNFVFLFIQKLSKLKVGGLLIPNFLEEIIEAARTDTIFCTNVILCCWEWYCQWQLI